MKTNNNYDFYWSEAKRSLVARGTTICVECLGEQCWHAFRCVGTYPCLDFIGTDAEGTSPNRAVNNLLRKEAYERRNKKSL